MSKHFFYYDDGDFAYTVSDNMAIDSDGNMMMRMGDNMAMDMDKAPRPHAAVLRKQFCKLLFLALIEAVLRSHLVRSLVADGTMGYRTFYFFHRRSPYIKRFSEYGGAKALNARIFLFYRRCAADFCFAHPYGKNQKVDRFIKRLQRKIKLFPRHILPSISASPGRVNAPADFDTI